ncbi:MAG: class I SAM-dependent methyltransferase [Planctomycetes bacterium]|nr:class I SAM-dependent methyltransferase [Planctomycetota bacterium]
MSRNPTFSGRRMALVLPCGDGAAMLELREHGVPSVGADVDAAAVQRCREQGLAAYVVDWRTIQTAARRFDLLFVDGDHLQLDAAEHGKFAAQMSALLLPGGLLALRGGDPLAPALARAGLLAAGALDGRECWQLPSTEITPLRPGYVVAPYADVFRGCQRVLEIGAGSGHFLDLLQLREVSCVGLELDEEFLLAARARGHTVHAAGFEGVAAFPAGFDGVFVGNLAEQLEPAELTSLLHACRFALQPRGRLGVRARRGHMLFDHLHGAAKKQGFSLCRTTSVPGDSRDELALLVADDQRSRNQRTIDLDRIVFESRDVPIEQPLRSVFDLERFERRVTSQGGEDGLLTALFELLGTTNRRYVEFGCGDGVQCNTAQLRRAGWQGLLMDGEVAPGAEDAVIEKAWITAENIEALFDQHGVPAEPDLLSIDVDGNDYWVLQAIRRRPRVLIAEYNANLGVEPALTIPYDPQHRWDGSDYYGASLRALAQAAKAKGYTLVYCTQAGVNAIFVRDDLLGAEPAPPLEAIYRPANYWYRGGRQFPDLVRPWQSV